MDGETLESRLECLRDGGWTVAVHNDYRVASAHFTFWLFTHPDGRYVKGEGPTDAEALDQVIWQAFPNPASTPATPGDAAPTCDGPECEGKCRTGSSGCDKECHLITNHFGLCICLTCDRRIASGDAAGTGTAVLDPYEKAGAEAYLEHPRPPLDADVMCECGAPRSEHTKIAANGEPAGCRAPSLEVAPPPGLNADGSLIGGVPFGESEKP
jgi:hypothetical protein